MQRERDLVWMARLFVLIAALVPGTGIWFEWRVFGWASVSDGECLVCVTRSDCVKSKTGRRRRREVEG